MRKFVLFVFAVFLFAAPATASAQSDVKIAELQVQLWPEYDQPSVLVIYTIVLAEDVSLPVTLGIRIPANAEINAVAENVSGSGLMNLNYQTSKEGDWERIEMTTQGATVQIEYYDAGLEKDGANRHFDFTWAGDYAVEAFTMRVQQPFDAFNMEFSPVLSNTNFGGDGLTYYDGGFGSLRADEEFNLSVDYQKSSDTLSATQIQFSPTASVPDTASPGIDWVRILPWALGVLGLGLIGFGGYRYWQTQKGDGARPARRRRRPSQTRGPSAQTIYCQNCGQAADPDDKFCRNCGTKLRR